MRSVDFYFGLGSRYSYLAFTQLDRIERAQGCCFVLQPLSSVELMRIRGQSPFQQPPVSGQYDWRYRKADAEAWATYYGVPYIEPNTLPDGHDHRLLAKACWAAHAQGGMRAYCNAIFQAVFVEHQDIGRTLCVQRAGDLGLDVAAFGKALDNHGLDQRLTLVTQRAVQRGVFGVPAFLVADRMFWGNDRLVLLEHYLAGSRSP